MAVPRRPGSELASQFLGTGVAFPFGVDASGGISKASGTDLVNMALVQILSTKLGERVMRRDFGVASHDLVFQPNDTGLARLLHGVFKEAVQTWEKRLDIKDLRVYPAPDDDSVLFVHLQWQQADTYRQGSLVFPFYVSPSGNGEVSNG